MSDETRFDTYLSARASALELPPAGLGAVLDRVGQRRRHRRVAASACVAVAVLGGALSVVNAGGSGAPEHVVAGSGNATLVASTLEWSAVTPRSGLAWSTGSVIGPDKALYSLSTAPGSTGDDGSTQVLYRSTDGIEWAPTNLPTGLHAASITSAGQSLYAVGTAPAGGGTGLQLASSTSAGATWTKADVPLDLDGLTRRYGMKIGIDHVGVASNGTRTLVAASVSVQDDLGRLVPGGLAAHQGYNVDEHGITLYAPIAVDPTGKGRTKQAPEVAATYTWDDLGVDAALRSLILGETRIFVSDDGAPFAAGAVLARSTGPLLSTAEGFRIVGTSRDAVESTVVLTSLDGQTWQADPRASTPGWAVASGVRRDLVAFVSSAQTDTNTPTASINVQQPGGSWTQIDVVDVLRRAGASGDYYPGNAAVGPLGVAVLMFEQREDGQGHRYLVTTTDGTDVSVIDLEHLTGGAFPGEVRVAPDAITISLNGEDGAPQRLLVGTPSR